MEQKQRENEEYIARKNSEIAELEKEHEELKRRNLFDIDLEKKVQDQKSDVDIEKSLDSIRTDMEQTVKVSSNAADQNGTSSGSPSTRDLKHQTGSSENTSEGTIVMTVGKISTLSDKIFSAPKRVQGVSWRIVVMPIQRVVEREKKQQKYLGVFLQCCPDKHSDAWSCKADAEMRLMPKKAGAKNFVRETNHVYTSKEDDWGYSCFMPMADVLDENNGYIKYDMITLKITVKAEGLKNLIPTGGTSAPEGKKDEKKADDQKDLKPKNIKKSSKEEQIAKGAKVAKVDYPTIGDVALDWDSEKEKVAEKTDMKKEKPDEEAKEQMKNGKTQEKDLFAEEKK